MPDTLMSLSVNAAVCPTTEEQEKRWAAPRWQRSAPPEDGASLEGGSHQAEQMHGGSPGGGRRVSRSSWAPGARPRSGSNSILGPPAPATPGAPGRSPRAAAQS